MKNILYIFLLASFCINAQEKDCAFFKTGNFKYVLEEQPEIVIRTDSTQVEINPIDKIEIHSTVEWVSDCEYVLTYKRIENYPEDVSHIIGKKNYCEILETKGNWMKVHAKGVYVDAPVEFIKLDD
ncbi:hypothetical protein A7A78_13790 [Aequorivita soesokkakensis]|uniref:Uncharacterized protein n=1 Tax=Aequorivita soesokkakensis TaxID=1385699 RepID=A0A1A9LBY7_9FLAO|nr:hypothetical protein [Aequorivita soesokkakensis]OAD90780.1 hypothetical protein A7A78_13790 [Aequorivita soesokkakensis]